MHDDSGIVVPWVLKILLAVLVDTCT